MPPEPSDPSRREFLSGRALRTRLDETTGRALDAGDAPRSVPVAGPTVRLETTAMACEFVVAVEPGDPERLAIASGALDLVHDLETAMTIHRADGELFRLNARAAEGPVEASAALFDVLTRARDVSFATDRAYDPSAGPLTMLWRDCRREGRVPSDEEIADRLEVVGIGGVAFDPERRTVAFARLGMSLDLGGIGKGYALDRIGGRMTADGLGAWLVHGGRSTVVARGGQAGETGWPVGIRNPLFPEERLGTIVLRDAAWSTSGNANRFFRHGGERYGHLLDPRTGRPVDAVLSVSVKAPTGAEADALSTAFFVAGVEKTLEWCDHRRDLGVILFPPPARGRTLAPIVRGLSPDELFL